MAQPIINPPMPYVCPINDGFMPGKMVRIRGYAAPNGDRFDVNFQTRMTTFDTDDIAFHISVRLLQGYIARNSFRDGEWEEEEDQGGLPILPGQGFEMLILCEPTQFKVAINGKHYCDFRHRLSYTSISHFGVDGDVTLNLVSFEGSPAPPMYGEQPNMYGGGQPGMYGIPNYGQPVGMPPGGMPSAPPSYAQAVNMPPVNPQMGMPGAMTYAPRYPPNYPPM